jgi:hypothetical protein
VNPADPQLIAQIQQVTNGAARMLVTLARRGKAIERDDPQRAAFLLTAVGAHPFYKGGRLTFDMLEIEDVILEASRVDPMSVHDMVQLLQADAHRVVEMLRQTGSPAQIHQRPHAVFGSETNVRGVLAGNHGADAVAEATGLARVSFGPAGDAARTAAEFSMHDNGRDARNNDPELRSSDYLYDYVVLGFLDVIGAAGILQI